MGTSEFFNNDLTRLIAVALAILAILIIIRPLIRRKRKPKYILKNSLLTQTEIEYYDVIRSILGSEYMLLPQINLASIIDKKGDVNFRNELFRNVDFGVFDCNFRPLFLIEINDGSHFRKDRIERDEKVKEICKKAKIPLLTFWVKDGINEWEMRKRINGVLSRR